MDHSEHYLVALWFQLEGNIAATFPGDGKLAGRIELSYLALHPALGAEAGRPLAGRVGQFVVTPDKLEVSTDLHLHLAGRQPLATEFALREIRPDALDRTGKKPLDLQRGRLSQHAIGVRIPEFGH